MPERPEILLADANVLIDYRDSDPSILSLAASRIAPIRVVHAVLEEVNDFDEARAASLGLDVVDVPTELLLEVSALPRRLRRADRLCYLTCREYDWICLTNDRLLRRYCDENAVRVSWGLELLLDLVASDALARERAIETARTIADQNPAIARVFDQFVRRLRQFRVPTTALLGSSRF
jgi:hypothetical protein